MWERGVKNVDLFSLKQVDTTMNQYIWTHITHKSKTYKIQKPKERNLSTLKKKIIKPQWEKQKEVNTEELQKQLEKKVTK